MVLRRLAALVALAVWGLASGSDAVQITMDPEACIKDYSLFWKVARYGPLNICVNGTVTFSWTGMHGVFQIPTIACPSNFTAPKAPGYAFLASASNGGSFRWEVPNVTGQYWVTSQWPGDCQNGMITEVYVTDPTSSATRIVARSAAALAAGAAALALLWA